MNRRFKAIVGINGMRTFWSVPAVRYLLAANLVLTAALKLYRLHLIPRSALPFAWAFAEVLTDKGKSLWSRHRRGPWS